ncbi:MAG TPA: BNR repeat-containing protein [Tepidisphaeraceae bacterium]|jgi:hypothetical protein
MMRFVGFLVVINSVQSFATEPKQISRYPVGMAWANDAVNADVFRVSSVISAGGYQFACYYAPDAHVVVARRKLNDPHWDIAIQKFTGNVKDAHNDVVLGISSDGLVHISYDHHGAPLHYRVSSKPYDIRSFGPEIPMTGQTEKHVTYPQFISAPDGNFYFFYRDGSSGNGNLCVNRYDAKTKSWSIIAHPLVDGENKCNPYWWRPAIAADGTIHLAWCWRDSGDASTNHDICYVQSRDQGRTWIRSDGKLQTLPITQENAEVVLPIPHKSNLINQCSSAVDSQGHPHLAQYFNDKNHIPQYFDVYFDGQTWHKVQVSHRKQKFSLAGGGSLAIPISRPEIACAKDGSMIIIAREADSGSGIRLYQSDPTFTHWRATDILKENLGNWEPTYDLNRLRDDGILSLFVLAVEQANHERTTNFGPHEASILEVQLP